MSYNILIGTPAYGGQVHTDYVRSILPLPSVGVNFNTVFIGNQSLITRARNEIFSLFVSEKASMFSHLLFLDADMGIDHRHVRKMLDYQLPFIGAAVPLKGFKESGNLHFNTGDELSQLENGLIEYDVVGTAVMMISRKLALKVAQKAIEDNLVYTSDGIPVKRDGWRIDNETKVTYDVFKVGVYDGQYLSEDFFFCRYLRKMDYKILVDPSIPTRHNGNYVFAS
tara:strand:+ start:127 stop:801 length:675 start_codon:yes stop_codon:yes gene_type:complete